MISFLGFAVMITSLVCAIIAFLEGSVLAGVTFVIVVIGL